MRRDSGSRGDIKRTFNQRTISSAAYNKRERERETEKAMAVDGSKHSLSVQDFFRLESEIEGRVYLFVGVTRSLRRQELFVVVGCGSGGVKMVGGSGVGEGVESLALAGLAESESLLLDMVPGGSAVRHRPRRRLVPPRSGPRA
jgi:hypothetical protein